jgi:anti-sigma-K factor RskA
LVQSTADKFTYEVDVDRQKFELLLAEKNEQEMEYEEKLKQADERSQVQLAALDTQYQVGTSTGKAEKLAQASTRSHLACRKGSAISVGCS